MSVRGLIFCLCLMPAAALAQSGQVLTKQYDDGGIYEGTFRGGLQHGEGTYRLPNGYEYTGAWVDGEIKGAGTARFPNGSVYEGAFSKGKPDGFGK
ncbi:MAG: 2-isopropylmalate synthase, partial [Pseudomonadota bacterium]